MCMGFLARILGHSLLHWQMIRDAFFSVAVSFLPQAPSNTWLFYRNVLSCCVFDPDKFWGFNLDLNSKNLSPAWGRFKATVSRCLKWKVNIRRFYVPVKDHPFWNRSHLLHNIFLSWLLALLTVDHECFCLIYGASLCVFTDSIHWNLQTLKCTIDHQVFDALQRNLFLDLAHKIWRSR